MEFDRRKFVQLLGVISAEFGLRGKTTAIAAAQEPTHYRSQEISRFRTETLNRKNFVGIQVKPFVWMDEGIDKALDTLQEKGNVNTVFVYTYDYDPNRTTQGGPIPFPDHGKYGPSGKLRTGGAFFDYDQKYFRNTSLRDFRSPDEPGFNVITAVAPKMKARKMDFFAWDYNNAFPVMMQSIPGFTEVAEVDVYGRRTTSAPASIVRITGAHLTGKIESYLSQYPSEVDGIMWGCERMGPIDNMIGGGWATTGICCFCDFCTAKARIRGISVDRAKLGYMQLDKLFQAAAKHERPSDGFLRGVPCARSSSTPRS